MDEATRLCGRIHALFYVREIYRRHSAGCCLHIVTDDGNVRDSDVAFCLKQAIKLGHEDCITAALHLMTLSKTQRRRIYHEH